MFASGDFEGTIKFWVADKPDPQGEILAAHESNNGAAVWDMSWHPLGHVLCTASNDQTIKFWTRNRPGDDMIYDKYNVLQLPPEIRDKAVRELQETAHLSSASRQGSLPERIANYQFSGEANVDVAEAKSIPGLGSAGVYMEKIRRRQSNPIPEQFSSMDYLPSSDIDMDRRNDLRDMDRSRSDGINKRSRFDR